MKSEDIIYEGTEETYILGFWNLSLFHSADIADFGIGSNLTTSYCHGFNERGEEKSKIII